MSTSFPEVLLHAFDWDAWNASVDGPAPTPPATDTQAAVRWSLGEAPAAGPGWSPGGEYGLLEFSYILPMLDRGTADIPELDDLAKNVSQAAINFAEYTCVVLLVALTRNAHERRFYPRPTMSCAATDKCGGTTTNWTNNCLRLSGCIHTPIKTGEPVICDQFALIKWSSLILTTWFHCSYHVNYDQDASNIITKLASAGYVVLAYDQIGFGLRIEEGTRFHMRFPRWSKLGRMVRDVSSAVITILSYLLKSC